MENGLLKKTGYSLQYWIDVVKRSKLEKYKEIINFLKSEHDFTHGFANFVALKLLGTTSESFSADELLALQYSKGKNELKPIYELLKQKINDLGTGIEFVPKKANVSVKTKKQFALIQPSTKTRIDIGLKLRDQIKASFEEYK